MQNRACFEAVHRALCDLKQVNSHAGIPFGGIPLVMGGDWAQTLPVIPHGNRAQVVQACLQRSFLWTHIKVLRLRIKMRLGGSVEDRSFADWLGRLSYEKDCYGQICLPSSLHHVSSLESLIDRVFPPDLLTRIPSQIPDLLASRALLAIKNDTVTEINSIILHRVPGATTTYLSADSVDEGLDPTTDQRNIPPEYLRNLQAASLPLGKLELKI